MKLNEQQRSFIIDFFIDDKLPGWKQIAEALIDNGECIVAGDKCVYNGGIGNFIKTESANDYVNCLKYTFDIEYFMSSMYFQERLVNLIEDVNKKLEDLCIKAVSYHSLVRK